MRTKLMIVISLTILMVLQSRLAIGQQRPARRDSSHRYVAPDAREQQRRRIAFYRRNVGGDSLKAAEVSAIMDAYKASMKAVASNPGLSEEARRSRYKTLIDEKDQKLKKILSPAEQMRLIPGERKSLPSAPQQKSN